MHEQKPEANDRMRGWQTILSLLITIILLFSPCASCATDVTFGANCRSTDYVHDVFVGRDRITCPSSAQQILRNVYLLFDVNPSEGFNLRRDVYIRLAVFVRAMQMRPRERWANLKLVLPPWRRLYHWKSDGLQQDLVGWSNFFDMESLRGYVDVLDFHEFVAQIYDFEIPNAKPQVTVYHTLQLLHFKEMFENGIFRDRYDFLHHCPDDYKPYEHLFKHTLLVERHRSCIRFQGSASLLERLLVQTLQMSPATNANLELKPLVISVLNAEIVLHNHWGDVEFWRARRSMRFAPPLIAIANKFRLDYFNTTNRSDRVQRPLMWQMEIAYRGAIGGAYLCGHLRRGDFVYGREHTTPTLQSAAHQIKQKLRELNLSTVFLATDANVHELKDLKSYLQRVRVVHFSGESFEQKVQIKDGGIAIVDQLICANARYFIGTYESTFTYRIYEEREILGFSKETTFNTFCKSETRHNCLHNSIWPIVY